MEPHAGNSTRASGFFDNVCESLARRNRDLAIEPSLATAREPVGDGAQRRFTLHAGVTFHDSIGTGISGHSSPRGDEPIIARQPEIDPTERRALLDGIAASVQEDAVHVRPRHWGAREDVDLTVRKDTFIILPRVTVN